MPDPTAYYQQLGPGTFRSTTCTQGAWAADEQHMSPVSALLIHALDLHEPRPELQLAKVTFDILGLIPQGEIEITVRTVRPGLTIELVQAEFVVDDRPRVIAHAWRHLISDTAAVAGTEHPTIPGPEGGVAPAFFDWPGGYIDSVEFRSVGDRRPGRSRSWLHSKVDLVDGVAVSDTARQFCHIDTANGLSPRIGPDRGHYPNTDLTVHLFRAPIGTWTGLDVSATLGPTGLGMNSTVLHDQHGPYGHAVQALTVRLR